MKFLRADIYGFAKWHDFQLDFQENELQIIYGENESGKSSLQQFILFMLFGLPPKKRSFFRSKTSGKMGGMLTIADDEIGEFTIERVDEVNNGGAKCLLPNGEVAGEEWLKSRLHGMTRETYQSIFSFDALDLSGLKTMKEEDLGEILLGVGLTGSTDIYVVEKQLDTKLAELFKPFGKKPVINRQLDYLDDLMKKVQTYKSQEDTYRLKKANQNDVCKRIDDLQDSILMEKKHVIEGEKVQQAHPNLVKLNKYNIQLESYQNTTPFPEGGMRRYETLKEKMLPLESELAVLQNNADSYHKKHAELKDSLLDTSLFNEIKRQMESQVLYDETVKEMKHHETKVKEQEISLANDLRGIDINHTLADLDDISLSYQTENNWIQLYEDSQQLRLKKEQLMQEEAVQKKQRSELENSLAAIQQNRLTPDQVDELTNRIQSYNNQSFIGETKQKSAFEAFNYKRQKTSMNMLIGSIIIGVIFGLIGIVQEVMWGYAVMVAFFGTGFVQWGIGKQAMGSMEQMISQDADNSKQITVTKEEKEEAIQLLASHDEGIRKMETIQEKLQTNKIEQIKWRERKELSIQKENHIEEKVHQQRKLYPILETIDVGNWPSFYHTFKSLLQKHHEWKIEKQLLADLKVKETELRESITMFFQNENWEIGYKSITACFAFLQEKVEEHRNTLGLMEQYEGWIHTQNEQINNTEQKLQVFRREQITLMEAANVQTEEEFYQRHMRKQEKKELTIKKENIMEQLQMLFSDAEIDQLAANNMEKATAIEEKQNEYHDKLKLAEEDLDDNRRRLAALTADLATMESSDDHSRTMHRFHLENAQLAKVVKRWAVLKTAKEIVVETKNKYRDKYMSRIVEQTSDYFGILTNYAYLHVYAPKRDQVFQVESASRLRYTVDELSQGTKDQLFIALRLAISEVMSDTHHMPFIIDDAFVHFDDIRSSRMMQLITSIAKNRQVLLFTCKKMLITDINSSNVTVLPESIRKN
ncbi:hypothetical protein CFK37_00960 [Virgibacillus phasianinus]|uniref:YhaN AAA domain-containing protein n=1 Tax=Virgibacillus phasianinus TaxID=2017483 RepID=A0A220TYJ8_9BACI|nr:AAA family ATPase [Virgibacillus phasianinus]ASK60877.1 hypothetical protein CFK37_00960 [Virgibacillus phasianinus]